MEVVSSNCKCLDLFTVVRVYRIELADVRKKPANSYKKVQPYNHVHDLQHIESFLLLANFTDIHVSAIIVMPNIYCLVISELDPASQPLIMPRWVPEA